ncbi:MAG: NAD-dependent epimerase/dehydratase family protein [Deltaproteobacteria bacterium]|nr:NAD-dependent epimerase/dehydratase family protein [Deltaproteobacteria bacterium]
MRAFVSGAPGWLGNRLVEVLCKGWRSFPKPLVEGVRCLVLPGLDASCLTSLGAEIAIGDLRKKKTLQGILEGTDVVFHLAGIIHPKRVGDFYALNTQGTQNLLEAAIESKVRRFVYVSSNSVSGCNSSGERLLTEEVMNPYKHYGLSKALAERAVQEAFHKGVIETVILRPCWFYGPGQPARQTRFFKMIKAGRPIVFGGGENLRSMSYIDNTIQGLLLVAESAKANGQVYWISDRRPYSVIEIYGTIARILDVTLKPRFIPALASTVCEGIDLLLQTFGFYSQDFHVAGEMAKSIACSIEKAERELGYQPEIELEQGMRISIGWCRKMGQPI